MKRCRACDAGPVPQKASFAGRAVSAYRAVAGRKTGGNSSISNYLTGPKKAQLLNLLNIGE